MLIFAIDDEPKMLRRLQRVISEAEPGAEVMAFSDSDELLSAMAKGNTPDVVFTDIEMPGISGLSLALNIKLLSPKTGIVFVTSFPQYASDAFRLHVNGYILKPVEADRIREELDHLKALTGGAVEASASETAEKAEGSAAKLRVRCFGNFEVFWQGEPLRFKRNRTRELFAYLVDREGALCSANEIIAALWEDGDTISDPKHYLRTLTQDLRESLASIGMEEVLIKGHGQWALKRELLDCDYYGMLDGDADALNSYRGEYMIQYSWAELTAAQLYNKLEKR